MTFIKLPPYRHKKFQKMYAIVEILGQQFKVEKDRKVYLKGSGLSSSAAFEDMTGFILSELYNEGKVDNVKIAKISQYAENKFFGKPCGLMDQVACAVGGFVFIDFGKEEPLITPIKFDLAGAGYDLCIVNTGGNHADLNED